MKIEVIDAGLHLLIKHIVQDIDHRIGQKPVSTIANCISQIDIWSSAEEKCHKTTSLTQSVMDLLSDEHTFNCHKPPFNFYKPVSDNSWLAWSIRTSFQAMYGSMCLKWQAFWKMNGMVSTSKCKFLRMYLSSKHCWACHEDHVCFHNFSIIK